MARPAIAIDLSPDQESQLRALVRAGTTPQQVALRAQIVLRAAEGAANSDGGVPSLV